MDGKVGDRIVIGTDKVGQPAREGEILEVIDHESGTEFVVRWDDGHDITSVARGCSLWAVVMTSPPPPAGPTVSERRALPKLSDVPPNVPKMVRPKF